MIKANFERYNAYKNSDIEWIENLPTDWKVKRLKEILSEVIYGTSEKTKEFGKYEVLGMGDINEGKVSFPKKRFIDDISEELLLKKEDLLFNRTNSIALVGKVGRIEEDLKDITFASYLIRLRVNKNQSSKYFWYFLNSEYFLEYSRSNAIQTANQANLSSSKLRQFKIIDIPLNLQKTIADYLDTKTAQIDNKINLLTQKATLYSNLKQSLINETVTRGLDKSAPMKDSGIEWIGEIPEHWEIDRAKSLFKKESRLAVPKDEIVTVFRDGQVTLRRNRRTTGFTIALHEHGYQGIRRGDLVIHAMDAFAGAVGVSDSDGKSSPVYSAYTPINTNRVHNYYYSFLIRQMALLGFISSLGKGIRERSTEFRHKEFSPLKLIVPPLSEQKAIADYLDNKTAQIDQIIQTINTQIEKLKELRKTLINDVVTGKIKV